MARRIVDLTDDGEEEDLAQFVPLARAPTDEEIHHIYPKRAFGGGKGCRAGGGHEDPATDGPLAEASAGV